MIPSRGLQPIRRAPAAFGLPACSRSGAARQFSSIRRGTRSSPLSPPATCLRRTSPLRLDPSAVRYASWYAPWSWGRSSTPSAPSDTVPAPQAAAEAVVAPEPPAPVPEFEAEAVASQSAGPVLGGHDSLESLMDQVAEEGVAADLTRAIENIGDLKAMGLDFGWGPTAIVEWLLEHIYIDAGLGWGAAIIAVACVVRVTLFPAQLWGSNNAARMACIGPLTAKSQEYLTEALRSGGTDAITAARAQLRNIYKQFNVSPFKSVAPMAGQAIIGFGAFRCLRGMTSLPVPGLAESGFLWFQDLTISDPYYTLPAAIGVSMYYVVKRGGETGASNQTVSPAAQRFMTFAIPCFTTLIAFMQPAGLQIYLLASVLLSGITATFLRSPGFRRQFNLHPLPSPESNELWKKVANGEIPLSKVMDNNGQLMPSKEIKAKYLAPNKAAEDPRRLLRDDIKLSGPIPAHLRPPPPPKLPEGLRDRDDDYDTPPPGVMKKLDWVARNYKPTYMYKRMRNFISQATGTKIAKSVEEVKKEAAKKKAEEYEYRRRQRFLNRR